MVTLYQLATQVEVGDEIRWRGEETDVEKPRPRTVTSVDHGDGSITVEAKGPQGGQAKFRIDESGNSQAWYGKHENEDNMGAVDKAELVDKGISTGPW